MRSSRKRPPGEDSSSSSSSKIVQSKRHHNHRYHDSSTASNFPTNNPEVPYDNSELQVMGKRSNFASYSEVPRLSPKVKILCEIVAKNSAVTVEGILEDAGIRVSEEDVIAVLRSSYGHPGPAVKFFRWSSVQLNNKHSQCAWNLVVDLLGRNCLFDAMWDAVKSMRREQLLSLTTFESLFVNYVIDNRVQEAILSFQVIDQYGVRRDVVALNTLLRVICSEGHVKQAKDFLEIARKDIRLDAETYAILLEGWEREGDLGQARQTFSEMLSDVGWVARNVTAYDSFLCTLLRGPDGMHESLRLVDTMRDRGCYPSMKFLKFSIDECVRKGDAKSAKVIWETMVGKIACRPDKDIYKSLISLYCNTKDFASAEILLDQMVYDGAFPDSETYGILFHFLTKHRRLKEAIPVFKEMMKNEFVPLQQDCNVAIQAYLDARDPYMANKIWRCMLENYSSDLEETANLMVVGLRDLNWVPEAVKCAEDIIERGIKLNSATLSKLKQSLSKVGKAFAYEELLLQEGFPVTIMNYRKCHSVKPASHETLQTTWSPDLDKGQSPRGNGEQMLYGALLSKFSKSMCHLDCNVKAGHYCQ